MILEGTFINGLKPELRSAVRIMEPESLARAMRAAVMLDENKSGNVLSTGGGATRVGSNNQPKASHSGASVPKNNTNTVGSFKRLTESEFAEKRAKGLCFRCDGKFTPGHRCPGKTLQVLIISDEEEGEEAIDHAHLDTIKVSLNSVSGLTPPHTMKVRGDMGGLQVGVLIDSGATHNFVSKKNN